MIHIQGVAVRQVLLCIVIEMADEFAGALLLIGFLDLPKLQGGIKKGIVSQLERFDITVRFGIQLDFRQPARTDIQGGPLVVGNKFQFA